MQDLIVGELPFIKRRRLEVGEDCSGSDGGFQSEDMDQEQIRARRMGPMLMRFLNSPHMEFTRTDPPRDMYI